MNKPYNLIISSAALLEPLYTQYLAEYFEVAGHRCPRCQGLRHGHGGHERWVLCAPGQEGRLFLRHVRCRSCHTVETVFPPWLLPYERLTVDLIESILTALLVQGQSVAAVAAAHQVPEEIVATRCIAGETSYPRGISRSNKRPFHGPRPPWSICKRGTLRGRRGPRRGPGWKSRGKHWRC